MGGTQIVTQDRFEILHKISNYKSPMQKHIEESRHVETQLRTKKSEYSIENKHTLSEINRHQHEPHWEGNFTASNLQPTYKEIIHNDVSFSDNSPK